MLPLFTMSRFEYFAQLTQPSLSEPFAQSLGSHLWTVLQAAVGFIVPRRENGDTVAFPMEQLQGQTYQEWVVRLPWMGGQKPG